MGLTPHGDAEVAWLLTDVKVTAPWVYGLIFQVASAGVWLVGSVAIFLLLSRQAGALLFCACAFAIGAMAIAIGPLRRRRVAEKASAIGAYPPEDPTDRG